MKPFFRGRLECAASKSQANNLALWDGTKQAPFSFCFNRGTYAELFCDEATALLKRGKMQVKPCIIKEIQIKNECTESMAWQASRAVKAGQSRPGRPRRGRQAR
jgi:hypothetical protein